MLQGEQEQETYKQSLQRQWNEKSGVFAKPQGLLEMAGFVPALGIAKGVANPGVVKALQKLREMAKKLDFMDELRNLDDPAYHVGPGAEDLDRQYKVMRSQANSIWRGLPKREQEIVSLGQKLRRAQRVKPEWMPDENVMEPPQANPDWLNATELEELGNRLMGLKKQSPYYK